VPRGFGRDRLTVGGGDAELGEARGEGAPARPRLLEQGGEGVVPGPEPAVETIGWLNRCRRLAKDWECLNRSALAFLRWASVRIMLRRLF
jgi:transposase